MIPSHNLLPRQLRQARQFRRRKSFWIKSFFIYLCALVTVCAGVRLAITPGNASASSELAMLSDHQLATAAQRSATDKQLAELRARLESRRSIAHQPDPSLLLSLLSRCLDDHVTLRQLSLRPTLPPPSAVSSRALESPRNLSSAEREPRHFLLTLRGTSTDEAGVARLSSSLRSLGLFDAVDLKRTGRDHTHSPSHKSSPAPNSATVTFEITCLLLDKPAPPTPTSKPSPGGIQ